MIGEPVLVALGVFATALVAWAMIWLLQPLAHRFGLLDHPKGRKDHAAPTPVTGGLGIALSLLLLFALVPLPMTLGKLAYLLGAGLLLLVGLLDDHHDLRWWWRILAQVVAALLMVYLGGVRIEQLGPAFGLPDLSLGVLSVPFTVFATVGLINAINMIDGADGIAGSLVAAALAMLAAAAWYAGNDGVAFVAAAIFGATLGFLLHNFPLPWRSRARVFLGNAGSAFLGYSIAWIVFRLTQNDGHPVNPVLALWLIPIPVIDCLVLIVRRIRQRRSPFSADRDHIHHLMRDAGFSTLQVALTLTAFSLLTGLAVGQAMRLDVPNPLLLGLFLLACTAWCVLTLKRERACAFFAAMHRGLAVVRERAGAKAGAEAIMEPAVDCGEPGLESKGG
ncbi:MraY family glycosyltransferase [Pseudoxanthomonas koreensis]|uniref:MraY family glycosyltransferase n=1 Tax=Pseudoxanthomonas koreensis TaxID=266061 RepID=UPI001390C744|nr:MraY family glycosyltransferase [Pseudoxanthomonas koreensis]